MKNAITLDEVFSHAAQLGWELVDGRTHNTGLQAEPVFYDPEKRHFCFIDRENGRTYEAL